MSFGIPEPPNDHFITHKRARELIGGELSDVYREIIRKCILPIHWRRALGAREVTNGTVTIVKSGSQVFGVTAAHVIGALLCDMSWFPTKSFLGNCNFTADVIDIDYRVDIATINLPMQIKKEIEGNIVPVALGNFIPMQEGRGLLLGGYPGSARFEESGFCDFGIFAGLGVTRRVYDDKITWSPDPDSVVHSTKIPTLPEGQELGGISGGPFIAMYEKASIQFMQLGGIIIESRADIQNVIARPAAFIAPDGKVRRAI